MANRIRTGDLHGFNKGRSLKFREGSRVQQTPEEGRRTYWPKHCGNNNKDEDNSPKTLNDKNQQALSQKFRQLIYIYIYIYTKVSREFYNILLTYLLYSSSHNKNSLTFKVKAIILLKPPSYLFFDSMLIPVFVLSSKELLPWSFHLYLVVEASWVQQGSCGSKQVIIWGS